MKKRGSAPNSFFPQNKSFEYKIYKCDCLHEKSTAMKASNQGTVHSYLQVDFQIIVVNNKCF